MRHELRIRIRIASMAKWQRELVRKDGERNGNIFELKIKIPCIDRHR